MPVDPTTYGLGQILTSPLVLGGLVLILGGGGALAWMFRDALGYYEPEIPPVIQPALEQTYIHPVQPVAANYRRPDSDTGVVPRIPGATPEAGPVCPFCGGPWHALCPSAPKERSDETVEIPTATEPQPSPLAPQFAALSRFFTAVDEARADTDTAMRRLAANARPDCPLTTHELVIPTVGETPVHRAIADREPTQELSKTMAKIMEATK